VLALAITGFGVIAGAIGLLALVTVWLHRARKKLLARTEELGKLRRRVDEYERSLGDHKKALEEAQSSVEREMSARKAAERQRDVLLSKLVAAGDPDGIAGAINAGLSELSDLQGAVATEPADGS